MHSRRVFLKNGALALVTLGFAPSFLTRTALADGSRRRRVLIAVFQRGAVDGLNMIVPHGEGAYYRSRPTIAVARPGAEGGALDLDGFFGLHPRMAPLKPWFDRGALAIVHATGSPDATRSHFDAQDYMESATPGVKSTRDGWLNRYLSVRQAAAATPFRGVAVVDQMPRSLQGAVPTLAVSNLERFDIGGGAAGRADFEAQYAEAADTLLGRTGREAFEALGTLTRIDSRQDVPEHGARYPRSPFGEALRQIAILVKADVGLEVAFAETGNWDHHVNEGGATGLLSARLDDFAGSLAALATDLGNRMSDVVILTMSEFGRTVAENGNRGTDHGHGNAMLVLGGPVRGGRVLARWPGLADHQRFEGRDLAVTTDFRDVFAEVVVRHLGVTDASPIFPAYPLSASRFPGLLI